MDCTVPTSMGASLELMVTVMNRMTTNLKYMGTNNLEHMDQEWMGAHSLECMDLEQMGVKSLELMGSGTGGWH